MATNQKPEFYKRWEKGGNMKRYKRLTTRIPDDQHGAVDVDNIMAERSDGEWVKVEDFESDIIKLSGIAQAFEDRTKKLRHALSRSEEIRAAISVNCICAGMSDPTKHIAGARGSWICPAHGYKRL